MYYYLCYRILFNVLKINNRILVILVTLSTIFGSLLIADWQTIGYDSCKEYSGEKIHSMSLPQHCIQLNSELNYSTINLDKVSSDKIMNCKHIKSMCNPQPLRNSRTSTVFTKLNLDSNCFEIKLYLRAKNDTTELHESFKCNTSGNRLSLCIDVYDSYSVSELQIKNYAEYILRTIKAKKSELKIHDHTNNKKILLGEVCINHEQCHWNQFSEITGEKCFSCSPICRNKSKSMSFVQFSVGIALFVFPIPISRVILMILISEKLAKDEQVSISCDSNIHISTSIM